MYYTHRLVELKVTFNGLYLWGEGWVSSYAANRWKEFLCKMDEKKSRSFWEHFTADKGGVCESEHLISTSVNVYLHPMSFHTYLPIQGTSSRYENGKWIETFPVVRELFEIATELAEYCGGTAELSEFRIHEFEDNGKVNTKELDYNFVCK